MEGTNKPLIEIEEQSKEFSNAAIDSIRFNSGIEEKLKLIPESEKEVSILTQECIKKTLLEKGVFMAKISQYAPQEIFGQLVSDIESICGAIYAQIAEQVVEVLYAQQDSRTDILMGINNRREFNNQIRLSVERSARYGEPFSIAIIDLDHFKNINDTYGHLNGDTVLKEIARRICEESGLRKLDIPCRYGGEELVIIFPQTVGEGAVIASQRVSKAISEKKFTVCANNSTQEISVTASIGVAQYQVNNGDLTGEKTIENADTGLYMIKHGINEKTGESLRGGIAYNGKVLSEKNIDAIKRKMTLSEKRNSLPPPITNEL